VDPLVFILILICAAGHAAWNSVLKARANPRVATTMLAIGGGMAAMPVLFVTGMPDPASYPLLLLSVVIHIFYWTFLGRAYAAGDFGQVYPLARGIAPLITATGALVILREQPGLWGWIGIGVLVAGVLTIACRGGSCTGRFNRAAVLLAATTALTTASYTLVDGIGARLSGSGFAYAALLYACNGWALLAYGLARQRQALFDAVDSDWHIALAGGALSLFFYGAAVWAMTAAPIALVAALRESGVLAALVIGTVWLKEPLPIPRVVGAVAVCAGLVVLRLV
jgi:drug/metabolite transporter (DMT)-like permease